VDVLATLVADRETTKLVDPGHGALNHPAVATEPLTGLDALAGDADLDPASMQEPTTARDVIRFVRVQLRGTFAGPTTRALDGWNGIDQVLEDDAVVPVRAGDDGCERGTAPIYHNMALRARFAAIRRVGSGRGAPLFAGTLALSRHPRSQSIWSASPRRSKSARWSRSQTPASCQSRSRRQQVMPVPQPSSGGNISQGMPLFSTKMMPVKHARSGIRGRPPFGFGNSFGTNGSTIVQSSSLTNGLLMPSWSASPVPRFC